MTINGQQPAGGPEDVLRAIRETAAAVRATLADVERLSGGQERSVPAVLEQCAVALDSAAAHWQRFVPVTGAPGSPRLDAASAAAGGEAYATRHDRDPFAIEARTQGDVLAGYHKVVPLIGPLRVCNNRAARRIEAYSPPDGHAYGYGSLDWVVYACGWHDREHVERVRAAGMTSYSATTTSGHRCGSLHDYRVPAGTR